MIDERATASLSERKATCRAGSNIAFIKYWGVAGSGEDLNIPLNNSISMTLADAHTTTTVAWDDGANLPTDTVAIDGVQLQGAPAERIVAHLDRLRALAGVSDRARVVSNNNFPMASGIASSASGFAALTVAGAAALGLRLDATRLSAVARQGSGSASRSLFGGFVEWERGWGGGEESEEERGGESLLDSRSVARQLHSEDHWALRDVIAIVSAGAKRVSSSSGHRLAATSPLNAARTRRVGAWLDTVRQAIVERDIRLLGPVLELDALAMHGVMMTSTPSLLYWQPGTLEVLQAVRSWREDEGVPVYFTIDAGPNVHLICEAGSAAEVERRVGALPAVRRVLTSGPGTGPQLLDGHLF
ncbi:MAG: diphosphomevalonate decarboxylase [Caldilineaceae bacterium]|nr:diphosphomevalonate decarboxylase [Caldilineaceae bacterium]